VSQTYIRQALQTRIRYSALRLNDVSGPDNASIEIATKHTSDVTPILCYQIPRGAMSNTDFLGRAIETVKKAIDQDTAGEYEKAYQQYYQACAYNELRRGMHG